MADSRTLRTVGAMRLLTVRSVVRAAPACWPRIISTTRRAFCGETRIYLASALIWIASSISFLLCRLGRLLRGRLHGMALERARGRKLAQLVADHVLRDV